MQQPLASLASLTCCAQQSLSKEEAAFCFTRGTGNRLRDFVPSRLELGNAGAPTPRPARAVASEYVLPASPVWHQY